MITGVDLVEHQLRVAANERLSLSQDAIRWEGHAIEARINAEDPERDFEPGPGTVERFRFPDDRGPGVVRVDTHLTAPAEVPPFYDSLVAKVIAAGSQRGEAIETLRRCLASSEVDGVPTTIGAHLKILESEPFRSGRYDTGLVGELDLAKKG
jgi:acetyl-CoA carboxylase biotin carboxylase subunit